MDGVVVALESIPPGPDAPDDEPDHDSDLFQASEEKPAPGAVPGNEPDGR
jgi:hypothetical protein